ncbi:MAG TPA: hypothetical protein VFM56_05615 [Solimonas sp.]|nr:hypothetical protein [Solimonas sp.]
MNTRGQRILLWIAPAAGALFLLAYFLFPIFSASLSPTQTPDEIAAFFHDHGSGILGVSVMINLIGGMLIPLFAVTAVQMSRIGNSSPVFTYSYILCVGIGTTAFLLADYCWGIAAYRPDRNPQLLTLLNDMGWFLFTAPVGTILMQNLCLALAIYLDTRAEPVFPRWVAHFNVATAVLFVPGAFTFLHKTGPLAWNGILSFDLRVLTFAAYVAVMFFVLLRIVGRQTEDVELRL